MCRVRSPGKTQNGFALPCRLKLSDSAFLREFQHSSFSSLNQRPGRLSLELRRIILYQIRETLKILIATVTGQDPGWLLGIHDEDKIELFNSIRMIQMVPCAHIQISNYLVTSRVVTRPKTHGSHILGFNENDAVLIRNGHIDLGDALSMPHSISLPNR